MALVDTDGEAHLVEVINELRNGETGVIATGKDEYEMERREFQDVAHEDREAYDEARQEGN